MIPTRTYLSLAAVVLGCALVVACTHGPADHATDSPTSIPSSALLASTAVPAVGPPTPTGQAVAVPTAILPAEIRGLEWMGHLGTAQAQAIAIQGNHAIIGFGTQLAVVDISDPSRPQRLGYAVLPNWVLDVAVAGSYAYVATGRSGLHVVELSDPTRPAVLEAYYASLHVNGVFTDGSYAYVSAGGALHILDLSDPAAAVEIGAYRSPDLVNPIGKVATVVGDYAYTIYHGGSGKTGGLRIVDVSDPAAPVEVGVFVTGSPVRDATVAGDYAYLLVGQGVPRLDVVDISDPEHPVEVGLDPMVPWLGESLAVADGYAYLACRDSAGLSGYLQVLDVADPAHPIALGLYTGLSLPVAEVTIRGGQAYVAAGDGLHVVDVTDPTELAVAGFYHPEAMSGSGRDVVVAGDYAYLAAGGGGFLVVDISDPAEPRVVSRVDTAGHAWDVALAGGYAYLADEYNGLRVIDVADPFYPVEVGFYDVPESHEFFHGVAVKGGYAYIADGGLLDTGLRIMDISDPASPTEVSFLPIEIQPADDSLPARAEDVAAANGYVYLAVGTAGLRVVDVSDPAAPAEVGFYDTPGRADNLIVVDHIIYLADGDLRIVDVSNPTAPAPVGFYDIPGTPSTPHVTAQGRYAYVTGNGIQVLDISDPGSPVEVAKYPLAWGDVAVNADRVYVIGNGLFILRSLTSADTNAVPEAAPQTPPPTGDGECETHTAAMTLSATATTLRIGEVVTVTATLFNHGCGNLGMPQYQLHVRSDEVQPLLAPEKPEPAVHYLGIAPEQSDGVQFALRAVAPGKAMLSVSASFEFHLGYPGPAYWGGVSTEALVVTVKP